jgi:cellulose synthase/poly-beta-1,6-N-acetylglucosamine synthase-like glycosyltransferase
MIPSISQFEWYLLLILLVPLCIQLIYYLGFFSVVFGKNQKSSASAKPVSVIVCAKNEVANLKKLIPVLCEQYHPKFEIIVVNDGSWDESNQLIEEYKKGYPHLKNVYLDPEKKVRSGKKLAITIAIKAAQYEHLVFTDADCLPESNLWLQHMSSGFDDKHQVVLGYSPYQKRKGILNWFIRVETQFTAMLYLSAAKKLQPYMSVGRNWAYTKSLFYEVKGFAKHHHIVAGDDDLLMQMYAVKTKAAICMAPESFCSSEPKTTFSEWVNQKRRHLQIGKYYNRFSKFYGGLFVLSHFWFVIAAMGLWIALPHLWLLFTIILVFRYLMTTISFSLCAKKLKDTSTALFYPFADLLMMVYWLSMGVYVYLTKKKEW